jgi:hypothetical protein
MKEINNPDVAKVISAAVTGTTFMTLFSYLVSETKNKQFKEPRLLATLLYRLTPQINKQMSQVAGWGIHYSVGFIFAVLYAEKWRAEENEATVRSGLMLGGLSGLFAIIVWRSVFTLHPVPPKINYKKYYGHLLLAHFIFGAFTSIGYNMISSKR